MPSSYLCRDGTMERDEIEDAFAAYQKAGLEAGRTGKVAVADMFTEDATYIEHHYWPWVAGGDPEGSPPP